jgi:hypothetical protein
MTVVAFKYTLQNYVLYRNPGPSHVASGSSH